VEAVGAAAGKLFVFKDCLKNILNKRKRTEKKSLKNHNHSQKRKKKNWHFNFYV